jgi:hypothetical protein
MIKHLQLRQSATAQQATGATALTASALPAGPLGSHCVYCSAGLEIGIVDLKGNAIEHHRRLRFDVAAQAFHVHGEPLFRLGRNATVQSLLLSELERAGWPELLSGFVGAARRRGVTRQSLRDAIKALNARQTTIVLHIKRGALRWKWREPADESRLPASGDRRHRTEVRRPNAAHAKRKAVRGSRKTVGRRVKTKQRGAEGNGSRPKSQVRSQKPAGRGRKAEVRKEGGRQGKRKTRRRVV